MKFTAFIIFIFTGVLSYSQTINNYEKYPVFPACEMTQISELPECFKLNVQNTISAVFKMPEIVVKDNYKGRMDILFEVTKEGAFKVIYANAAYAELKEEVEKVFGGFPIITAATFDGKPVYTQYSMQVLVP